MNVVVIAELGLEGEGTEIHGVETDGQWSFWQVGWSMFGGEDGEGQSWKSEPVSDLAHVVPTIWPLMFPARIHPDFVSWFRDHYQSACDAMPAVEREILENRRSRHWQSVFTGECPGFPQKQSATT
jgi:hypothetical protein